MRCVRQGCGSRGGGYYMVSDRENEPIALSYFAAGYQVFVLKYTLGKEHTFDEALTDADGAVAPYPCQWRRNGILTRTRWPYAASPPAGIWRLQPAHC